MQPLLVTAAGPLAFDSAAVAVAMRSVPAASQARRRCDNVPDTDRFATSAGYCIVGPRRGRRSVGFGTSTGADAPHATTFIHRGRATHGRQDSRSLGVFARVRSSVSRSGGRAGGVWIRVWRACGVRRGICHHRHVSPLAIVERPTWIARAARGHSQIRAGLRSSAERCGCSVTVSGRLRATMSKQACGTGQQRLARAAVDR